MKRRAVNTAGFGAALLASAAPLLALAELLVLAAPLTATAARVAK